MEEREPVKKKILVLFLCCLLKNGTEGGINDLIKPLNVLLKPEWHRVPVRPSTYEKPVVCFYY